MEHILTDEQYDNALELLRLFKIDGKPADEMATPSQVELFGRIVFKLSLRQFIMTNTQFGKSLFVALACIILTGLDDEDGEQVKVIAPTEEKAMIIMRYYMEHLGDSPLFSPLLDAETKVDRLAMSTSRDALVLKNKGSMFALTANAGNSQKGFEAVMGEGADVVILDEGCLIPDPIEATIFRMITGRKNGMYVKIGNPFYAGTHFQKSSRDPRYLKLIIDYHTALQEGRVSQEVIDEARDKPFFSILWECKFPQEQQIDTKGYTLLYKQVLIDIAYIDELLPMVGEKYLGIDLSGGGENFSTIVMRGQNMARLMFRAHTSDPLVLIPIAEDIARKNGIPFDDRHIFVDKTGAVAFCARLNELHPFRADGTTNSFGVIVGEKADPERHPNGDIMYGENGKPVVMFINKRAQLAWKAWQWVQIGNKLYKYLPSDQTAMSGPAFDELLVQRYKIQSDKKIKLKSKEEMAEEGIMSPDVADAFNLTFAAKPKIIQHAYQQPEESPMTNFGV